MSEELEAVLRHAITLPKEWGIRILADALVDLRADNAALLIENDSLRGFVGSVFNDYSEAWGTDIDGLRMQELGIAYGLLHKVAVTEEMHDSGDHCENCDGECDECYRFTTLTQSCVNDLRDAALLAGKKP